MAKKMHRFIKKQTFQIDQIIELDQSEKHHMKNVMRKSSDESIELINKMGQVATCTIQDSYNLKVINLVTVNKRDHKKSLAMGLCHPTKLEIIIEKACELGVDELIIYRAEKSAFKKLSQAKLTRLETKRDSALKQSKRAWDMEILLKPDLFSLDLSAKSIFLASIDSKTRFKSPNNECIIIVGPESGFTEKEINYCMDNGAQQFSLGDHILRAETAAIISSYLLSC